MCCGVFESDGGFTVHYGLITSSTRSPRLSSLVYFHSVEGQRKAGCRINGEDDGNDVGLLLFIDYFEEFKTMLM